MAKRKYPVPSDYLKILGENIYKLRKEKNLSIEELAHELRVTYATARAWEKGVNSPPAYHIHKLSKIFGVSIDKIIPKDFNISI